MVEIQFVLAWLATQARTIRARPHDDRGDIVQTAVIIGLFVAAALVIVGILVAKAKAAAENVKTQ